jgi:hypothetical protein
VALGDLVGEYGGGFVGLCSMLVRCWGGELVVVCRIAFIKQHKTNKQANKQTNKQSDKQKIKQTNKQTNQQTKNYTSYCCLRLSGL